MSILLFIVILVVLIVVHELGHFLAAKKFGVRVDEFGLGYPPRIATIAQKGETRYTLNAIPFGGFVKIFGENPDEESTYGPDSQRSFVHKPRWVQAIILAAGVAFNLLFAWLLLSIGFMTGMPASTSFPVAGEIRDAKLTITAVGPDSPASAAGLKAGDEIISISQNSETLATQSPEELSVFIASHGEAPLVLRYRRAGVEASATVEPKEGIVAGKKAIGISMDQVGILRLPPLQALATGAQTTWVLTLATVVGLADFLSSALIGQGDFSQVTGPVGIVGLVGDASALGVAYLLSFTAFISINLAIINLVPFPALDGGRLLFVAIEAVKRSPINPKFANVSNLIGFALLLLLMIIVTFNDIARLL